MRRLALLVVSILLIIIGLFGLVSYQRSFGKVSIKLDGGVKAQIVEGGGEDPGNIKTIANFESNYSGKLKRGSYVLAAQAEADYRNKTLPFTVSSKPAELSISLDYSATKLAQLLTLESVDINQVFNTKYVSVAPSYTLVKGQLFARGEWFGALLVPVNVDQDTLRVVMNKKDGKWTVATDPPDISLNVLVYPGVPKEILQAVNSL